MFSFVSLNHVFYGYQITVSVMKSDQNSNINRKSETGTHSPGFPQGEAERGSSEAILQSRLAALSRTQTSSLPQLVSFWSYRNFCVDIEISVQCNFP